MNKRINDFLRSVSAIPTKLDIESTIWAVGTCQYPVLNTRRMKAMPTLQLRPCMPKLNLGETNSTLLLLVVAKEGDKVLITLLRQPLDDLRDDAPAIPPFRLQDMKPMPRVRLLLGLHDQASNPVEYLYAVVVQALPYRVGLLEPY